MSGQCEGSNDPTRVGRRRFGAGGYARSAGLLSTRAGRRTVVRHLPEIRVAAGGGAMVPLELEGLASGGYFLVLRSEGAVRVLRLVLE